MADRLIRRITTNEPRSPVPRLLELRKLLPTSWSAKPPMQMQFVLQLASRRVLPLSAALHGDGGGAEYLFELRLRLRRPLVAFDRQGEALEDVLLPCVILAHKHRDRRAEDHRLQSVGGAK